MPDATIVLFPIFQGPLHHVVPTTTLVVATCGRNGIGNLMGKGLVALLGIEAVHPREVPRHLEVVTHHATRLVNTPLEVMGPVLIELLVHEGAVAVVREVFADGVERVLEELGVTFLTCGQVEIDQVGRRMVANGVPVFLGFVDTQ